MLSKQHPENAKRLEVLRSFDVLDSGSENTYDELTRLTAKLCESPVCLVSLVDKGRQWFKSEVGLGVCETHIEQSICAHAVYQDNYLEIEDTQLDARTVDNSLCIGEKSFRFYAGAIIRSLEGLPLGTLCVLDYKPRRLTALQRQVLSVHANSVGQQFELTRVLIEQIRSPENLPNSVTVLHPETRLRFDSLTPREAEIVQVFVSRSGSMSSKEVGRQLGISPRTVDHHRASIMAKMNVNSVAELMAVVLKTEILSR